MCATIVNTMQSRKKWNFSNLRSRYWRNESRNLTTKIEGKKEEAAETQGVLDERKKDLGGKKAELDTITKESEADEQKIEKDRKKAEKNVEDRLLKSYERLRKNMRNGLAVVPVNRGACGGCFNIVPPQKQAEIREKKS